MSFFQKEEVDKFKQEEVNWSIATTYAADVETQANMGYEWGKLTSSRRRHFDEDDADEEVQTPKRKKKHSKKEARHRSSGSSANG